MPTEVEASFVDEIGKTTGIQGCSTMTKTAPPTKKRCLMASFFVIKDRRDSNPKDFHPQYFLRFVAVHILLFSKVLSYPFRFLNHTLF